MNDERFYTEKEKNLDELIRASMKLADEPSPELNQRLKAALYQK